MVGHFGLNAGFYEMGTCGKFPLVYVLKKRFPLVYVLKKKFPLVYVLKKKFPLV